MRILRNSSPPKKKKYIPVHNINVPGGGIQQEETISDDTPVYSSYTGELVGYGPIAYGTRCDAPEGHKNHGKNYHVIVKNPVNGTCMVHAHSRRYRPRRYK